MKNIALFFTVLFCLTSCSKRENKVEIYLLKNRKDNLYGVQINKLKLLDKYKDVDFSEFGPYTTFDTIKGEIIDASEFKSNANDIQNNPFIEDNEIVNVNFEKKTIEFNRDASLKILNLKPDRNGVQFIITVNKKPMLNGYFWNSYSSLMCNANCIQYRNGKITDSTKSSYTFSLFKGLGTKAGYKTDKIEEKEYMNLITILKESNKLTSK